MQTETKDTEALPEAGAERAGAQDDLESLLKEFESSVPEVSATEDKKVDKDDIKKVVEYVSRQEKEEAAKVFKADVEKAIDTISESLKDLPVSIPKNVIKGALYAAADENPKFVAAFQQRRQNPETWNKVLGAFAKNMQKDFSSQPDKGLTDDRDAVLSAVRSASTARSGPALTTVTVAPAFFSLKRIASSTANSS